MWSFISKWQSVHKKLSNSGIKWLLIHRCWKDTHVWRQTKYHCRMTKYIQKQTLLASFILLQRLFDVHVQDWCNNKESKLTEIFNHFTFRMYISCRVCILSRRKCDQCIDGFWCMMTLRCLLNNINQDDLQANRSKTIKLGQARLIYYSVH